MSPKTVILTVSLVMGIASCGAPESIQSPPVVSESPYYLTTDKMVNIDGVDIRYRDEGDKELPVIVMVHGFTSSLETWDALSKKLRPNFRIIRLDLPGHGLSGQDPSGDYSNAKTVEIFSQILEKLDVEKPTVVGNSLGGLIAWRTAAVAPSSVGSLVLISPGGFSINGVTEKPAAVPMMVKLYLTKVPSAGVRQATSALYGDPEKLTDDRLKDIEDLMKRPGHGEAFVARAGQFTLPDPRADLKKVYAPTLIIWGNKDIMVPPSQGPEFVAAMPNAALINYNGIGHVPQEEAPDRLAQDIQDFLSDKVAP